MFALVIGLLSKNCHNHLHVFADIYAKMLVARRVLDKLQMQENIGVDIWMFVSAISSPWGKSDENITAAYGQWTTSINVTYAFTYRIAGAYCIFMNSIGKDAHTLNARGSRQNGGMLKVQLCCYRPLYTALYKT